MVLTANFNSKQFVEQNAFNSAFSLTTVGLYNMFGSAYTPGFLDPSNIACSLAGTVLTVTIPFPTCALFASTQSAFAHGTVTGADTQTYTADCASLAAGEVYWYVSYIQIQQGPFTVVGPPVGHPAYNPNFIPYTAYSQTAASLALGVGASVPAGSLEVARAVLSSGGAVSGLDTTHVVRCSVQVGLPTGTYRSGIITVDGNGRISSFSQQPVGAQVYQTPGNYNFTVPANVFYLRVDVFGGGGGGGGASPGLAGSGAESGAYAFKGCQVLPGQVYGINVAAGGAAGAIGANGAQGAGSSFGGYGIALVATGGVGGIGNGTYATVASSFSGADWGVLGGQGDVSPPVSTGGVGGRGGQCPHGGAGASSASGAPGGAARSPGGGGGGGGSQSTTGNIGGRGADGGVFISWGA